MNQKLILENWRKYLKEEVDEISKLQQQTSQEMTSNTATKPQPTEEEKTEATKETIIGSVEHSLLNAVATAKKNGISPSQIKVDLQKSLNDLVKEEKKKKSGDRCTRIAKRKYDVWPSAYASGAVVKCRQGKIWKGISENMSDQEIDDALLLEEVEVIEEEWSEKYKRSINCKNPKGFSQRAHCQGKKKNEDIDLGEVEIIEEAKKKAYKPNFSKEKEQGLHGWFARNDGNGWVNCRTGGPCGRDSADKGGKYPACRPTKAQCKSAGKGPLRKKKSSSPISWTKKKKKD
jgi:hypothetical protein